MVCKAAVKGIAIQSAESRLEGDLDSRAFLELELAELAEFSPVLDIVRHGTPVTLEVEKA